MIKNLILILEKSRNRRPVASPEGPDGQGGGPGRRKGGKNGLEDRQPFENCGLLP